ncbi:membrane protein [Patiriisocius marinus]|uniref:Membrane protein n=1 Tax=Patiriisocius marinus TaxID=1397112 RepID=A0A5J4J0Q6_9FLAO|nr:DUF5686 and carboxypeptidase regulatory-like domain-containing protein [Patiriisocius marinus]GER60876.1 membrane protein [Patiriisocius marinus]
MKYFVLTFLLLCTFTINAQVIGKVTDTEKQPLPYVNVYVQDTYSGTTTNDDGLYELNIESSGNYTIIFQFLGYTTITKKVTVESLPFILNVELETETTSLDEVVIEGTEDPAYRIIRATIAQRKENLEKISEYKADFYSRGLWKVKDVPEKILGQEIGDMEGALDSTRSGIIYLSESISKISFKQPNDFNERIIASKVSGNDNGFSFNSAQEATFSFYENTLELNTAIVSPIANNAFSYYDYKLDGVFYEDGKLINKVNVIPKRPKDRVFKGVIYIVEDDWQLYGVEISTTGAAIQVPFIKELKFKQNFKYDKKYDFWVKISQTIDFGFGFMGLNGDGRYICVYSNYDFNPQFDRKSFSNEVLSFEPEANKKDSAFWNGTRPVALTIEEFDDYIKKDSLQVLRRSKPYLDSIDHKNNKFNISDPLFGYTYSNTFKKYRLSYTGPVEGIAFSTIQGYNSNAGINYFQWFNENQTKWISMGVNATYGIEEDRLRFTGYITKNFNRKNNLRVSLYGGSKVTQFNELEPISPLINSISTLFFERNYLKAYELNSVHLAYRQELFNGLEGFVKLGYEERAPLFNNSEYYTIPTTESYTSNNPLAPADFNTAATNEHTIFKSQIQARITFGQKYFSNPDMKFNIGSELYPRLDIIFENGLGASNSNYNYSQLSGALYQNFGLGNKGEFYYRLKGGTFFNGDDISFVDYQHFNGNQTRVGTSPNYTNTFNLLPYYDLSTNKGYFEAHAEHDFRGWILGKIPGINQLNFNLVVGGHFLATEDRAPYSEWSVGIDNLGFGVYRLLRVDYVRSYRGGVSDGAFVFGLKFLDLFGL